MPTTEELTFKEQFGQAFDLRSRRPTQNFIDEMGAQFTLGSDENELDPEQRIQFDIAFRKISGHYEKSNLPSIEEAFKGQIATAAGIDRLDILESKIESQLNLSEEERQFFAYFGVLPPHPLQTVSDEDFLSLEKQLDLLSKLSINSSLAYLFSKELLGLVLNEEVVSRVASLLGDQITFLGSSGPMYKSPNGNNATEWHNASARNFGGGLATSNFDIVTCWVALNESSVARGCMKILPRSYPFNYLKSEILKWDAITNTTIPGLIDCLLNHQYRFDLTLVKKMICRRLLFHKIDGMHFAEGASQEKRYSPFHMSIDAVMALGQENLRKISPIDIVAMEAIRGDMYMFSTQNSHGSFDNNSGKWRKAIALRFVKTGAAGANFGDDSFELLKRYYKEFPKSKTVIESLGKSLEVFQSASPRILIRGEIPKEQTRFYIEVEALRKAIEDQSVIEP